MSVSNTISPAGGNAFTDDDEAQRTYADAKRKLVWRRRILPALAFVALILLWEVSVRLFGIKPYIAPAPSAVLQVLIDKFPMLMQNLGVTAIEALSGYLLGNFAAICIATIFVYSRVAEEAFFPIAVMINTIPTVAKAPILVLLLGNGLEPKIAIAAMICFFPTLVNMTRGLRDINQEQVELMHVLSASPREVFFKVRLKNALPHLFAALKITSSNAVIGAIVAEWIGSTVGIGALIILAAYNFDSPLLYATVVVGSFLSVAFFFVVSSAERYFLRWSAETHR
jgi:NitT/TauT family transport system permease protein